MMDADSHHVLQTRLGWAIEAIYVKPCAVLYSIYYTVCSTYWLGLERGAWYGGLCVSSIFNNRVRTDATGAWPCASFLIGTLGVPRCMENANISTPIWTCPAPLKERLYLPDGIFLKRDALYHSPSLLLPHGSISMISATHFRITPNAPQSTALHYQRLHPIEAKGPSLRCCWEEASKSGSVRQERETRGEGQRMRLRGFHPH